MTSCRRHIFLSDSLPAPSELRPGRRQRLRPAARRGRPWPPGGVPTPGAAALSREENEDKLWVICFGFPRSVCRFSALHSPELLPSAVTSGSSHPSLKDRMVAIFNWPLVRKNSKPKPKAGISSPLAGPLEDWRGQGAPEGWCLPPEL